MAKYNTGLYSYTVLYNLLMLKNYTRTILQDLIGVFIVIFYQANHVWLERSSVNPGLHNVNPRLDSGYLCKSRSEMKCV